MPGMPSRRAVLTLLAASVVCAAAHADAGDDPFGSLQWPDLKREFFGTAKVVFDERVQVRGPAFAEDPMNVPVSVTALGLPGANLPFASGRFQQHLEVPGLWLERGHIDATDERLLNSPLGLAGHRCLASAFFITGSPLGRNTRQDALDAARTVIDTHSLAASAGATSPNGQVVIVRTLAPLVEPAMDLMRRVRAAWRGLFWELPAANPRIWAL